MNRYSLALIEDEERGVEIICETRQTTHWNLPVNWNWHPLHGNYGTVLLMGKVYYLTRPALVLRVPVSTFEYVSWFVTSQNICAFLTNVKKRLLCMCRPGFSSEWFSEIRGHVEKFASSAVTMIMWLDVGGTNVIIISNQVTIGICIRLKCDPWTQ